MEFLLIFRCRRRWRWRWRRRWLWRFRQTMWNRGYGEFLAQHINCTPQWCWWSWLWWSWVGHHRFPHCINYHHNYVADGKMKTSSASTWKQVAFSSIVVQLCGNAMPKEVCDSAVQIQGAVMWTTKLQLLQLSERKRVNCPSTMPAPSEECDLSQKSSKPLQCAGWQKKKTYKTNQVGRSQNRQKGGKMKTHHRFLMFFTAVAAASLGLYIQMHTAMERDLVHFITF